MNHGWNMDVTFLIHPWKMNEIKLLFHPCFPGPQVHESSISLKKFSNDSYVSYSGYYGYNSN